MLELGGDMLGWIAVGGCLSLSCCGVVFMVWGLFVVFLVGFCW